MPGICENEHDGIHSRRLRLEHDPAHLGIGGNETRDRFDSDALTPDAEHEIEGSSIAGIGRYGHFRRRAPAGTAEALETREQTKLAGVSQRRSCRMQADAQLKPHGSCKSRHNPYAGHAASRLQAREMGA